MKIVFDKLSIGKSSKGWCVMIRAEKNKKLRKMQREISKKFSAYGSYLNEECEKFEKNFKLHITITRHLDEERLKDAKSELFKDLLCLATVKALVLTAVKKDTFEEWGDPKNKFYCRMG